MTLIECIRIAFTFIEFNTSFDLIMFQASFLKKGKIAWFCCAFYSRERLDNQFEVVITDFENNECNTGAIVTFPRLICNIIYIDEHSYTVGSTRDRTPKIWKLWLLAFLDHKMKQLSLGQDRNSGTEPLIRFEYFQTEWKPHSTHKNVILDCSWRVLENLNEFNFLLPKAFHIFTTQ